MATKFYNISTDTTLGGSTPSDYTVVSQKAIKTYVDSQTEHIFVNFTQSGEVVSCDKRITDISNASINGYVVIGRLGNSLFHLIGNSANTVSFISYDGDYIKGTVVSNVDTWKHTSVDYVVNPITAPTAGQVLANDGNGNNYWTNVGGVGYLDSNTTLWTLSENLYFVKEGVKLYFDGSSVSRYIPSTGGLLSVSPKVDTNVWHYYPVEGSTQTVFVVYSGYSSAVSGEYKVWAQVVTTNDSGVAVGAFNSVVVSDFNVNDYRFSKNGILQINAVPSTLNQPLSIATQAPYRGVLAITSANDFDDTTPNEFNIRQELYVPSLNRHFYRIVKYYNDVLAVNTGIANCDANGWVEVLDTLPSFAGNNGKVLGLVSDNLKWVDGGGGSSAVTATELVDVLCGDDEFQTWAAAQVPQIPVEEPRGWDDDIETIITVYSRFLRETNNVGTSWNTVISNDVDGDGELYGVGSIGIADETTLGAVRSAGAYDSSVHTQGVVVNPNDGKLYTVQGGGGGSIATLSDVSLTTLTDGQTLEYNATSQKWENKDKVSCIYYEY